MYKFKKDSSILLLLGVLFLLLSLCAYALKPQKQILNYNDFSLLQHELEQFKESNTSFETIDFGIFQGSFVKESLDTSTALNFFSEERYNGTIIYKYHDCSQISCENPAATKDDLYRQYLCGHISKLPFGFFSMSPFMSDEGYSFAYLAYHSGFQDYNNKDWLKSHRQYLSLPEIIFSSSIRNELDLDAIKITPKVLSQINNLDKVILQDEHLLIKEGNTKLVYRKYTVSQINSFLNQAKVFKVSKNTDSLCVLNAGEFCFSKIIPKSIQKAHSLYNLITAILFSFSSILIALSIFKFKKQENQSSLRKLALDNLTHDFRTPVSNMVLMSKNFDKIFERSGEAEQIQWLSFSSEVHKLHRATEETKNYMQLLSSNRIQKEHIESINSFVGDLTDDSMHVSFMNTDFSVHANAYWLHVCVRNLIKNAKDHGGKDIAVKTLEKGLFVEIQIIDSGKGLKESFDDALTEFIKNPNSPGLGLGLSIVHKSLNLMNASLSYSNSPTTFSIKLKKGAPLNEKHPTC